MKQRLLLLLHLSSRQGTVCCHSSSSQGSVRCHSSSSSSNLLHLVLAWRWWCRKVYCQAAPWTRWSLQ